MSTTIDYVMPSLGADMDAGTVTEWLIAAGDEVARGDVVAIVETDKADIDIEVWQTGTVVEILVPPGDSVPVGTPLARLAVAGGQPAATETTESAPPPSSSPPPGSTAPPTEPSPVESPPSGGPVRPVTAGPAVETPPPAPQPGRHRASPLARRLAAERGLAVENLVGTGPDGAVVARDVEAGAVRPDTRPDPDPGVGRPATTTGRPGAVGPAERGRLAIAALMSRSKREIPHYYLATAVDLDSTLDRLERFNGDRSVQDRVLPAALLTRAVALAAAKHQEFNGHWVDDRFRPAGGVNIGVAISLRGGGLVAPAIGDADRLTPAELMATLKGLVERARSGRLRSSDMVEPTITVTNLGDRGVDEVIGVIHPPQVALVGFGSIAARPLVVDGRVVARRQVNATLAADHRATDGQVGARFLNTIERLLRGSDALWQSPETGDTHDR